MYQPKVLPVVARLFPGENPENKFCELVESGVPMCEIANRLGVSLSAVSKMYSRLGGLRTLSKGNGRIVTRVDLAPEVDALVQAAAGKQLSKAAIIGKIVEDNVHAYIREAKRNGHETD